MQFCRVFISCSRHQAVSSLRVLGHSVIAFFIIDLVVLTNDMFVAEAVAYLLLLAVGLLCAYEFCAVYVTAGASASELNSPSGFFFGVSAISLAINMLFICKILFNGKASNFLLSLVVSICHSLIGTWLNSSFFARFMHSKWI
jgi:type IV secretory pathway VirB3-like protein